MKQKLEQYLAKEKATLFISSEKNALGVVQNLQKSSAKFAQ